MSADVQSLDDLALEASTYLSTGVVRDVTYMHT